jgi:putative MATE family efflux protein
MASKSKKIDMTTGSIMRNVLLFAIPIIIGNVLQQLYTTVDTLVIGNFCGDTSLAAVGTSSQPVEVLLCIFLGIGTGVSILISQYIGAGDKERIHNVCKTSVFFVYVCGIPIGIIGVFCTPFILKFMAVPEDAWDAAITYTSIVFLGTLGNIGYNMNAGILRGMGDSVASLWFLVVSCITNIVLDLVFVAGFGMDVGGAALSTSIAMYLSWIMSVIYIRKRFQELNFTFLPHGFSKKELKNIIAIGLPIGLNNSLYSFGHMVLQTMVNSQGSVFMAGASVAGRITGLSNIAISALSSAATTFSGQNYGARNYERIKRGHIKIPVVSGLITLAFGLCFLTIRMPILRFFSKDDMVLMYASRYVVVLLLSQWFFAIFNGIMCIVNGIGKVKYTTVVNVLMLWAVRIPCAFVITKFFDGTFVMLCFPISFCFGMLCMIGYYIFSSAWKDIMKKADAQKKSKLA